MPFRLPPNTSMAVLYWLRSKASPKRRRASTLPEIPPPPWPGAGRVRVDRAARRFARRAPLPANTRQDLGDHIRQRTDARHMQWPRSTTFFPRITHDERGLMSMHVNGGQRLPGVQRYRASRSIVARNARCCRRTKPSALRHVNAPLHVAVRGPTDVRQRIAENSCERASTVTSISQP